ncbi:hypothetical protein GIB67_016387 [Kingdonia uniflora]|uniref:Secreted protein n=1 Tax=Kingdonia uniflora TaxID=39325 RepID=A0A7J7MGT7_9MAGN|nr:hypothetical protein GIB67_016387 [Kingdonia uniflora]
MWSIVFVWFEVSFPLSLSSVGHGRVRHWVRDYKITQKILSDQPRHYHVTTVEVNIATAYYKATFHTRFLRSFGSYPKVISNRVSIDE